MIQFQLLELIMLVIVIILTLLPKWKKQVTENQMLPIILYSPKDSTKKKKKFNFKFSQFVVLSFFLV